MSSNERLEHYIKYALVPTMGAVTATLSAGGGEVPTGFYHYGGPAISVDRTFYSAVPTSDVISASGGISAGTQVFATDGGLEIFKAFNVNANIFVRDYVSGSSGATTNFSKNGRFARVEGEANFGSVLLSAGQEVNVKTKGGPNEGLLASTQTKVERSGSSTYTSTQISKGDWRTDGEEIRGFLGMENGGAEGWIDIGWDNDSLVIYDWAVNFDGQIVAGQTEAAAAVPGAGGIAALAMGAAGLRRRRKRSA